MLIAHVWPSIGPMSVWELTLADWLQFATAADHYARAQRDAHKPPSRRGR